MLIVEDDESLRRVVVRHLRSQGFLVEEAGSAETAAASLDAAVDVRVQGDSPPSM